MTNSKTLLAVLISSTLFTPVVSANEHNVDLDDLVITASRTDFSSAESLSSVSVITRQDIETFQYQTLAEALSSLPGISITNLGGLGKQTSLFMRGTESNHTQILLNGVKLATNGFGAPQIEHLPLASIERIEVVRGPQSGLYGSSSIGGTIQIFTKKATSEFTPFASATIGSDNTRKISGGFSASNEKAWVNLEAGYTGTDGFDACDGRSATQFIGCFADEPDDDGYQNRHHSLRAGVYLNDDTDVEVFSLYSNGDSQYDGFYNHTDFKQHTYGAIISSQITDRWQLKSQLSQGKFDAENKGAFARAEADNTKDMFSLQSDVKINAADTLTIGYDFEQDERTTLSSEVDRDNHGYFAQIQGQRNSFDYRLTLRHDDNDDYGNFNSGNIALGYAFTRKLQAYISYGEAFTAPSFVDLAPLFGNPDLAPEESKSIEVGLKGINNGLTWSVALFDTDIDNLIALDSFFIPQNISEASIKGLELTAQKRWFDIDWNAQLTLLDPTIEGNGSNKGNILPRRAENTVSLKASKAWQKFNLATEFNYAGRRFDDNANTRRLDPYVTVDVIAAYRINSATSVSLKVANLFDESYETASGYNANDTNALLSISYSPK
jgi:vitamin B12 transporter